MSRHVTYRGLTVDMDSLRRENEQSPAVGNMKVNARGDQIDRGMITRTADQIARDNHRVQTAIVNTGLKGKPPSATGITIDTPKPAAQPTKQIAKKTEKELPSGDIIIENDNDNKQ